MKNTLMMILVLAGAVQAQTMSLLSVTSESPVLETPVPPAALARPAGPDAFTVTMLARVIAAEAGGNSFSKLPVKTAVGGAMVNQIKKRFGVKEARAEHIQHILIHQPGFLSSWRNPRLHKLFEKDAAWFKKSAYSDCLVAASNALGGQDPSRGATNWYDNSIGMPKAAQQGVITARGHTAINTIVFYRHK